jgi:hypothetical protein
MLAGIYEIFTFGAGQAARRCCSISKK